MLYRSSVSGNEDGVVRSQHDPGPPMEGMAQAMTVEEMSPCHLMHVTQEYDSVRYQERLLQERQVNLGQE